MFGGMSAVNRMQLPIDNMFLVLREASRGRLGMLNPPRSGTRDGVPFPTRLDIPNARIVSLAAGGM